MCSSCFYVFWPLFSILTFAEIASNQPLLRGYDTGKRWNSTVEKTAIWRNEALYQCTSLHCRDITTSPAMIGAANIFEIWADLSWMHLPNLSALEIPDFTGLDDKMPVTSCDRYEIRVPTVHIHPCWPIFAWRTTLDLPCALGMDTPWWTSLGALDCTSRDAKMWLPGNSANVTFLGWWKRDPFKWLSDLRLRDEKVTFHHLVHSLSFSATRMLLSWDLFLDFTCDRRNRNDQGNKLGSAVYDVQKLPFDNVDIFCWEEDHFCYVYIFLACWEIGWITQLVPNMSTVFEKHVGLTDSRQFLLEQPTGQWIHWFLVVGGRDYITPKRRQGLYLVYMRYILPIGWLYTTCHLLQEPEKSVEQVLLLVYTWCTPSKLIYSVKIDAWKMINFLSKIVPFQWSTFVHFRGV